MAAKRNGEGYFCQWCAAGDHRRCQTDACECRRIEHAPGVELRRRMLSSRAPDLSPAIRRGVFDDQAAAVHAHPSEIGTGG